MRGRLDSQVAIVTGGADGIGRAIAELFAREGAKVCIADVNRELGEEVKAGICDKSGDAIFVETDIAEPASIAQMVEQTVENLGEPSVLVNNAGFIAFTDDPAEATPELWHKIFAVNLEGMWECSRAVLPFMRKAGRGSIVNLGSVHSFQIVTGHFPYAVTKHGVIGLTRSLAVEYGPENIRVNALCPGMVETPTALRGWEELDDPAGVRKWVGDLHPLKRSASCEEMAYPALFLACEESSFMTGQSLVVDGGRSAFYSD
ncbi:glucose 1-dehydrogenase [Erythrobacter sp. F6033]|uniref:glucose 1-dehydrogenase n=1 Tax=Erythrobacter sp. F6033 TaxID=2926401 RepID=UPI001FF47DE3|nr:glucose 1-dehydrogenase [Erythrobacter sp. F6033]MCK0129285.1 glucose 1-dehydrogenase [Erythrobacter sp. F6033]